METSDRCPPSRLSELTMKFGPRTPLARPATNSTRRFRSTCCMRFAKPRNSTTPPALITLLAWMRYRWSLTTECMLLVLSHFPFSQGNFYLFTYRANARCRLRKQNKFSLVDPELVPPNTSSNSGTPEAAGTPPLLHNSRENPGSQALQNMLVIFITTLHITANYHFPLSGLARNCWHKSWKCSKPKRSEPVRLTNGSPITKLYRCVLNRFVLSFPFLFQLFYLNVWNYLQASLLFTKLYSSSA